MSFQPWEDLSAAMQDLVTECAFASTTIFSSPRSDAPVKLRADFQYQAWADNIPLEISPDAGWLQSLDSPIFVALDHFVEPSIISSTLPCIWVSTNDDLHNISQAVSLANRATKIFGSIALKNRLNISEFKFTEISSCSVKEIALAILKFEQQTVLPDYVVHEIFVSEIFGRKGAVSEMVSSLNELSSTQAARLSRFADIPIPIDGNPTDDLLKLALAVLSKPETFPLSLKETLISSEIPLPLKIALEIGLTNELKELKALWDDFEERNISKEWTDSLLAIFLEKFLALINIDSTSTEDVPSMILDFILAAIKPSLVSQTMLSGITWRDEVPAEFFTRVRNEGAWDAAVAAQLELWIRDLATDVPLSITAVDQTIADLDKRSWHPGLWKTALALLRDEPTYQWDPSRPRPVAQPSQDLNQVLLTLIGRLEQEAKSFAAQGLHTEAITSFEQVRLLCGLTQPPTETTELASRLNIYAISKKVGKSDKKSFQFLSSTLDFLQPPVDILDLRLRLVQLKSDLEAQKTVEPNSGIIIPKSVTVKRRVIAFLLRRKATHSCLKFIMKIVRRLKLKRVQK